MPDSVFPIPGDVTLGHKLGLTDQWLRVWRLILINQEAATQNLLASWEITPFDVNAPNLGQVAVYTGGGFSSQVPTGQAPGLETYAAGLRIHFTVQLAVSQTPNNAEITLYNLADSHADQIIKEFNYIILQCGYQYGFAGSIFTGSIKAYKKGHDSATDSYLKIYAADGDQGINKSQIAQSFPPGTEGIDKIHAGLQTMEQFGISEGYVDASAVKVGANARTDVWYGMTVDQFRDFASANDAIFHVLDQRFYWAKPDSYLPGDVVVLNARTGLVGFPEMTQDGINVTCLINPRIRLRQRIHLDNKYINQYVMPGQSQGGGEFIWPGYQSIQIYAPTNADGIYMPVMMTYEGDSRSGPWYIYMVCAAVDESADPLSSVLSMVNWDSL